MRCHGSGDAEKIFWKQPDLETDRLNKLVGNILNLSKLKQVEPGNRAERQPRLKN